MKRTLQDAPHPRSGLSGDEVILGLEGNRSYNVVEANHMFFFVFPYADKITPPAIIDFLGRLLGLHIRLEQIGGQPVQLPIVANNYKVSPAMALNYSMLSTPELLDSMQTLSSRFSENYANVLIMQQAKTSFFL